jgi:hypothetical protein
MADAVDVVLSRQAAAGEGVQSLLRARLIGRGLHGAAAGLVRRVRHDVGAGQRELERALQLYSCASGVRLELPVAAEGGGDPSGQGHAPPDAAACQQLAQRIRSLPRRVTHVAIVAGGGNLQDQLRLDSSGSQELLQAVLDAPGSSSWTEFSCEGAAITRPAAAALLRHLRALQRAALVLHEPEEAAAGDGSAGTGRPSPSGPRRAQLPATAAAALEERLAPGMLQQLSISGAAGSAGASTGLRLDLSEFLDGAASPSGALQELRLHNLLLSQKLPTTRLSGLQSLALQDASHIPDLFSSQLAHVECMLGDQTAEEAAILIAQMELHDMRYLRQLRILHLPGRRLGMLELKWLVEIPCLRTVEALNLVVQSNCCPMLEARHVAVGCCSSRAQLCGAGGGSGCIALGACDDGSLVPCSPLVSIQFLDVAESREELDDSLQMRQAFPSALVLEGLPGYAPLPELVNWAYQHASLHTIVLRGSSFWAPGVPRDRPQAQLYGYIPRLRRAPAAGGPCCQ